MSVPYWKYGHGHGSQCMDQWFTTFACEERKAGNDPFAVWRKRDDFTDEQTNFLRDYWDGITAESERNLEVFKVLKQNKAAKDKLRDAYGKVWLREETVWDKTARVNKPTGIWKSGSDDAPGITQGVAPHNGKSGGHDYNETIRPHIGVITARPKSELIALVAERLQDAGIAFEDYEPGTDWIEFITNKFESWRPKSRKLFHNHGDGIWSTVHRECVKISQDELEKQRKRADEIKRKAKVRTGRQDQIWTVLGSLPHCEPSYDAPQECPRWKHVEASPDRLETLRGIQLCAESDEKRELPLPEYLAYLCKKDRNAIL